MRILFVNGYAFLPQIVGGIEVSTLDLCRSLQTLGHETAVLCTLIAGDALWLKNRIAAKLLKKEFPMDRRYGMRIYRGWSSIRGLQEVTQQERPDAIVVQGGLINSYEIAAECVRQGFLTFYYTHDVGVIKSGCTLPDMTGVNWIANSHFTAQVLNDHLGVSSTIIPPIFHADNYRVKNTGNYVTMINPRPEKGGHIAVRMAELCPDIPFKLVEAWNSQHPDVLELKARATKLHNVQWLKAQTDMQKIYSDTRVLLAPSQCEETWGRVVTEAQFSGIPVLASHIGALPETTGRGGMVISPTAPIEEWVNTLQNSFFDQRKYEQLSTEATLHSQRDTLIPSNVSEKFIAMVRTAM